ncbi:MAG: hypothetical protein C6W56_05050 [Caldibacillus debilis]|nr:MAG: hypothetical protein C6W56_05050 [Caldibacillus debilis]
MGIGRRTAEQKSGACRFFGKGIPKKWRLIVSRGEFCPGSNCPIPKKWGLIVSGEPERRARPFSEQDFRLYYPEGKDMRKTTDSAEKVRSVIGGKSGQSYF